MINYGWAFAAMLLMTRIGGDVDAGGDFTGRDDRSAIFNNFIRGGPEREPKTDHELLSLLSMIVRGNADVGYIGLQTRVDNHDSRLTLGLIVLIGLCVLNFAMLIAIFILIRSI